VIWTHREEHPTEASETKKEEAAPWRKKPAVSSLVAGLLLFAPSLALMFSHDAIGIPCAWWKQLGTFVWLLAFYGFAVVVTYLGYRLGQLWLLVLCRIARRSSLLFILLCPLEIIPHSYVPPLLDPVFPEPLFLGTFLVLVGRYMLSMERELFSWRKRILALSVGIGGSLAIAASPAVFLYTLSGDPLEPYGLKHYLVLSVAIFAGFWIFGKVASYCSLLSGRVQSRPSRMLVGFAGYCSRKAILWGLLASLSYTYTNIRAPLLAAIGKSGLGHLQHLETAFLTIISAFLIASLVDDVAAFLGRGKPTRVSSKILRSVALGLRIIGVGSFFRYCLLAAAFVLPEGTFLFLDQAGWALFLACLFAYLLSLRGLLRRVARYSELVLTAAALLIAAIAVSTLFHAILYVEPTAAVFSSTIWVLFVSSCIVFLAKTTLATKSEQREGTTNKHGDTACTPGPQQPHEHRKIRSNLNDAGIRLLSATSAAGYRAPILFGVATLYWSVRPSLARLVGLRLDPPFANLALLEWILGFLFFVTVAKVTRSRLLALLEGPTIVSTKRPHRQRVLPQGYDEVLYISGVISEFVLNGRGKARYRAMLEKLIRASDLSDRTAKQVISWLDRYSDTPEPRFFRFKWRVRAIRTQNMRARKELHRKIMREIRQGT